MELQIYDEVEFYFISSAVVVLLKNNFIFPLRLFHFARLFFWSRKYLYVRNSYRNYFQIFYYPFLFLERYKILRLVENVFKSLIRIEKKNFPQRQIISESRLSHKKILFFYFYFWKEILTHNPTITFSFPTRPDM